GEVYAVRMGPLMASTGPIVGFDLASDCEDSLLLFYGPSASARSSVSPPPLSLPSPPAVPMEGCLASELDDPPSPERKELAQTARAISRQTRAMTLGQERWLDAMGIHGVGDFNRTCLQGQISQLVRVSEG